MSDWPNLPAKPGSGAQPRAVLDTDTFNEIDDQFALAYLLRSADRVDTEAIYAAPFFNARSDSPGDGMEKSYDEIARLLDLLGRGETPQFKGSDHFLTGDGARPGSRPPGEDSSNLRPRPAESAAASDLVERAMSATHSDRLNVIAIGALTNVASAIMMEPTITERCTVVWLGGHHPTWPHNDEFNLQGDVAAAQVVFDSGVPLYVMPCRPVASHLFTTAAEMRTQLSPEDPLAGFLTKRFAEYGPAEGVWSKELWDVAAVAWLSLPAAIESYPVPTPRIACDGSYVNDPRRPPCRFAYKLDRDAIFADLFAHLGPETSAWN